MKKTLPILKMSCASCAGKIETEISKLDGVESATVNFATEKLTVKFDEKKVSPAKFAEIVENLGYELVIEDKNLAKICVKVVGMGSNHCAGVVKKVLLDLDGVVSATTSFANQKAEIEFDPAKISPKKIKSAIEAVGYSAILPEDGGSIESAKKRELKNLKNRVIFASVSSVLIFAGSFAKKLGLPEWAGDFRLLFFLTTPVLFWAGAGFFRGAWSALRHRTTDMNTLVATGTFAAWAYSGTATFFPKFFGEMKIVVFFDTAAIIVALILLGKLLEDRARAGTSEALKKLIGLQAKTALVRRGGREIEIPIAEVRIGDIVIVKPGQKIPVDGVILSGKTSIDESMITGESMPAGKSAGDSVIGASMNRSGAFEFRAEKVGADTMLAQIIKIVEDAQESKAPIQRLADRVSGVFVPVVILIAVATFFVWFFLGGENSLNFAVINFVAVLIIACPCALGLARAGQRTEQGSRQEREGHEQPCPVEGDQRPSGQAGGEHGDGDRDAGSEAHR